jgi:aspartate 1-decarboxylase
LIIIANYVTMDAEEAKHHSPKLVYVDAQNRLAPKIAAVSNN